MSKELSAPEFWNYGQHVLLAATRVRMLVDACAQGGDDNGYDESYRLLQRTIRELHDILSESYKLPENFAHRPLSPDEIPF